MESYKNKFHLAFLELLKRPVQAGKISTIFPGVMFR